MDGYLIGAAVVLLGLAGRAFLVRHHTVCVDVPLRTTVGRLTVADVEHIVRAVHAGGVASVDRAIPDDLDDRELHLCVNARWGRRRQVARWVREVDLSTASGRVADRGPQWRLTVLVDQDEPGVRVASLADQIEDVTEAYGGHVLPPPYVGLRSMPFCPDSGGPWELAVYLPRENAWAVAAEVAEEIRALPLVGDMDAGVLVPEDPDLYWRESVEVTG